MDQATKGTKGELGICDFRLREMERRMNVDQR
jgi:hypothetical protein